MSTILFNIRIEKRIKEEMEKVCNELGITVSAAFNIFARKMIREKRIPFDVSLTNEEKKKSEKK